MVDQPHDGELPSALREPLSRNAQLLLHSRVPARAAWTDGGGWSPAALPWFCRTGRVPVLLTVQPVEASASQMWDATYLRVRASAR